MTAHVRPLRTTDLPDAERLSGEAFAVLDTDPATCSLPTERSPEQRERWIRRGEHLLAGDAAGCWAAEEEGELVGFAIAHRRERLWILASYAVKVGRQGNGVGRALWEAARRHAEGCPAGMLSASADPRAEHRYRSGGFTLVPQYRFEGTVRQRPAPPSGTVRAGTAADRTLLDVLDRRRRGAGHGRDHDLLGAEHALLVAEGPAGTGYAYLDESSTPVLICADRAPAAADLLRQALRSVAPDRSITLAHVSEANPWALGIATDCGLTGRRDGSLAVLGMAAPAPYLHHGTLL